MSIIDDRPDHFQSLTPFAYSNWPVLGIEVDWGSIQSTSEPAVWGIGIWRSPSIQYRTSQGSIVDRYPYYQSVYGDGITAVSSILEGIRCQANEHEYSPKLS